ncbi:hypothetical protein DICVIV_03425 [Dictyocaulus viviparus]|uniref:Uncharacterized protein n=1 Tax=Dictyocaulus viviparus TaxID=29172 RepID=A0A0D8Y320_DICVI|nr:hypothetical protein DICVIV_03425 [Dictyocaulus viviparus]
MLPYKPQSLGSLFSLFTQYISLLFIKRFFESIFGRSSEKLKLYITSTGEECEFGGHEIENNNE